MSGPACTFCASEALVPLPLPHPARSMLSDGRIWPAPLAKAVCRGCGAVCHAVPPDAAQVRRFYDAGYDLGADPGAQDAGRSRAYAGFLRKLAGPVPPARVLEIGCGSGQTLHALAEAWPGTRFLGLEAAERLAARPAGDRVEIRHGFAEDLAPPARPFDLVFAINVVEHAADPRAFVAAAARQLAPDGRLILVCPASAPPNLELVFQDHLHTFTAPAFERIAAAASLRIVHSESEPGGLAGFQVVVLAPGSPAPPGPARTEPGRAERVAAYLAAWQGLDALLSARTGSSATIDLFGAGEMAALLRCYAPGSWARVRYLLVDDAAGARNLGREVRILSETPPADAIVIATQPRAQAAIAARLRDAGHRPVVFSDAIAC